MFSIVLKAPNFFKIHFGSSFDDIKNLRHWGTTQREKNSLKTLEHNLEVTSIVSSGR